jgi:lysophospholipase L1-like esterase
MSPKPRELDPNFKPAEVAEQLAWYDALELGVRGQGWPGDELATPYDRLPARAQSLVRPPVWELSRQSAGLRVAFATDAGEIAARWVLRSDSLAMSHMPASGVSGLDLYTRCSGEWRWAGSARPESRQASGSLLKGAHPARREYLLYLPLYNGVESLQIGVDASATFEPAEPDQRPPICFYGTSIVHGGCASRPGMAYPAILGRRLDWPTLNLGFSGNGQAEGEMAELLAELDVACYVIDPLPNLQPDQVIPRVGHMVRHLRSARPDVPIVLVESVIYQDALAVARQARCHTSNANLKKVRDQLLADGVASIHYVRGEDLLGPDGDATVDGTHPTDLGFARMAEAIEPTLRRALGLTGI